MAGDTTFPRVWINSDVYVAPVGSTAPTNVASSLDAAYLAVGLLSEDGLTESREEESTDHYARGGILVRTTRSKHKRTFKFTCLESNPTVNAIVNPGSTATTTTGVTTRVQYVPDPAPKAWVFEEVDGSYTRRLVIAKGEVSNVGEVKSNDGEMTMFELTVTVYPSTAGVLYREITNDPAAAES